MDPSVLAVASTCPSSTIKPSSLSAQQCYNDACALSNWWTKKKGHHGSPSVKPAPSLLPGALQMSRSAKDLHWFLTYKSMYITII
eukprot:1347890-Amphidinium_carterae.1